MRVGPIKSNDSMQLDKIDCPLCNETRQKLIFRAKDYRLKIIDDVFDVVKCLRCEFIFLNPRPKRSEILNLYSSNFHKSDTSLLFKTIEPCFDIAEQSTIKMLKEYRGNGKTLDVGCGNGRFVASMLKNGYDAYGLEPNRRAENFASRLFRGRIYYQRLDECGFPQKTFDIITMFQSLEHVYHLQKLLQEVRRILKDNGIFYVCVPNTDFFESRLFGPYYYNLEVPRHLYFFTRKSLTGILSKNGFKVNRFLRNTIFESVSTPSSFYYGLLNFFEDNQIYVSTIIKYISFFPLIVSRSILRIFFLYDEQNLKVICSKA